MLNSIDIAKAKTSTRKKKKEAEEERLLASLVSHFKPPVDGSDGINGKDGKDAPTMEDIMTRVTSLIPEPRIEVTEKTIVQEINSGDFESAISKMIEAKLPEINKTDRPLVEQIVIKEDPDLSGLVTTKEFNKALKRIQDAITSHSGGGGVSNVGTITNIIEADEMSNVITVQMLDTSKINIIHATVSGSTVQLPLLSDHYIVWVEDAVVGGGNITITRES